jgi:hypothetical protein
MPKSPFPKYDPESTNSVYKRNLHVTIMLIFISILYLLAAIGCIIKLALPNYTLGNLSGDQPKIWAIWVNLFLFIFTIPVFMVMALKSDYLFGMWAPLKGLPLMVTVLVEIIVVSLQGMKWSVDWMEGVLLIGIPISAYILCVVVGRTSVGKQYFLPFNEESKQLDLKMESNVKPKPEIQIQGPTPPANRKEIK